MLCFTVVKKMKGAGFLQTFDFIRANKQLYSSKQMEDSRPSRFPKNLFEFGWANAVVDNVCFALASISSE